jgi:hypothetical protein
MPTTYTDQFWLIDASAPPPAGTVLHVVTLNLVDQNNNHAINKAANDSIDGSDITASYANDTIRVTLSDGTTIRVRGVTFYLSDGRVVFTPTDGTVLHTATFVSSTYVTNEGSLPVSSLGPPCFVLGTEIATTHGDVAVENLKQGDLICGMDGAPFALRLVVRRSFSARELAQDPRLFPVRITAGALGRGLPRRDMLVSRQHRMLVSSKVAERMFGSPDVLIPAIKLTDLPGIHVDETVRSVEYFHLIFDRHVVILAEGAPTESLYTGPEALKSISPAALEEIMAIFPDLQDLDYRPSPACPMPAGKDQKQLVARHVRNQKPLLELFDA